jgi:formylglycine-generating enzyme required for sulfatase activity
MRGEGMKGSIPQTLGKYKIVEEIGRGGFAAVYKATDTTLNRTVALKVLAAPPPGDPTFLERFWREARTAANLKHPNIVAIYEVAEIEDRYCLAMEFLPGRTLAQILKEEGALPPRQVAEITQQLASALDYAHARGFVHRDIKPSNIIIDDEGHVTLTDIGGLVVKPASDIYSLAIVCYEMLSGQVPFSGAIPKVLHAHVYDSPPPLTELVTRIPEVVAEVIHHALAKKPRDRFASAREMARALIAAVEDAGEPLSETQAAKKKMETVPIREDQTPRRVRTAGFPRRVVDVEAREEAIRRAMAAEKGRKTPTAVERPTPLPGVRKGFPRWVVTIGVILIVAGLLVAVGIYRYSLINGEPTPVPSCRPLSTLGPERTIVWEINKNSSVMVHVPAGDFCMGSRDSDASADNDEKPLHSVKLDEFWIDKYEVTNADFAQFVEDTGYQTDAEKEGLSKTWRDAAEDRDNHPVVYVSWNDAVAYCQWLGKRLPTEAEWEKAARGTDDRIWPWESGGDDEDKVNSKDAGPGHTTAVGSYPDGASPYGAEDMAGNAWEWVADWYQRDYYQAAPDHNNPQGPNQGATRVVRGGSWALPQGLTRCASRFGFLPQVRRDDLGFRCASNSPSP